MAVDPFTQVTYYLPLWRKCEFTSQQKAWGSFPCIHIICFACPEAPSETTKGSPQNPWSLGLPALAYTMCGSISTSRWVGRLSWGAFVGASPRGEFVILVLAIVAASFYCSHTHRRWSKGVKSEPPWPHDLHEKGKRYTGRKIAEVKGGRNLN